MPDLTTQDIADLLQPYLAQPAPKELCEKLQAYLALLERWNRKLNLTSVRDARQIVQRHFGESLFLESLLPRCTTLLDIGSGAGFPGLPISLLRPTTRVMLAEAQVRKAAFLREVAEAIGANVEVWPHRAEELPVPQQFGVVTLRAVEEMQSALRTAVTRIVKEGTLAFFTSGEQGLQPPDAHWIEIETHSVPLSTGNVVIARLALG